MRRPTPSCLLLLLPLFPSCKEDKPAFGAEHRVATAQRPVDWNTPAEKRLDLPQMGPANQGGAAPALAAPTPEGWEQLPAQPERFRDLLWRIAGQPDTECYLTRRVGGGLQANLGRWYDQFGQKPKGAVETLPEVELAGKKGRLLELQGSYQGKAGFGMLLAFTVDGDAVQTLKFVGPEAVVSAQRAAFLELARTLRPAGANAPAVDRPASAAGTGSVPGATPGAAANRDTPAPAARPAAFVAMVPSGWQPKAGSNRELHYTFGADGEVYLSQLGGDLRPMLDIWRGEMGLEASTDAEWQALAKVSLLGQQGVLLDLSGAYRGMSGKQIADARLLVAAALVDGAVVFVKLVGSSTDVAPHAESFATFCASIRRS